MALSELILLCCAIITIIISRTFLFLQTKTLSSLSNNSSFSSTAHGNYHSTFCLEKWNVACHISKPKMAQSSATASIADGELVSPEGTQEGKNTCHPAAIRLQPLPTVSPEGTRDVKTQDTGTRELRYLWKEWLQWAQTLVSSHT